MHALTHLKHAESKLHLLTAFYRHILKEYCVSTGIENSFCECYTRDIFTLALDLSVGKVVVTHFDTIFSCK